MSLYDIISLITKRYNWVLQTQTPKFLEKYRWKPKLIFFEPSTHNYIAVEIIYNQRLPYNIFKKEIIKALSKHKNFNLCLLTPAEHNYDILKKICRKNDIGLKIFTYSSVSTIVPLGFEKINKIVRKQYKAEGVFPRVILNKLKNVENVYFADSLKNLSIKLSNTRSRDRQYSIICKFINAVLQSNHNYIGTNMPFMKLSSFENMDYFKTTEHVFHSFRVFLVGCIIIDKFYDKFISYFREILPGCGELKIEYIWLLTSLFHDVGRIKQNIENLIKYNPKDENLELVAGIESEMEKALQDERYTNAIGNVVEFIKHCQRPKIKSAFTGYAMGGPTDKPLTNVLKTAYIKRQSHGVISCLEITVDLLRKISATQMHIDRTFLLYHIIPAAVSIALHDYHIWNELAQLKVFPLQLRRFPFAALLIYIDTWDDYKRNGDAKISIDSISFTNNECIVNITWYNNKEYLEEKAKYESFNNNISTSDLKFRINITNEKI